ncbi:MAG: hypothetical protein F4X19_16125 [Acidobacteria bacterium]|nr:hypothetical protein [Acidobacteriota bacterium]
MANKFATALKPKGTRNGRGRPRQGTRHIGGHFPPETVKQLRLIAVEEDTTSQALLEEALELLFQSRGKRSFG